MADDSIGSSHRAWLAGRFLAVAVFACVQIFLGGEDTPVADEARHMRDGAVLLAEGVIGTNPEHPPLVKMLAAAMLPAVDRAGALASASAAGDPMSADARFASRLKLTGGHLLRARLPVILLGVLALIAFGGLFAPLSRERRFFAILWLAASPPFLAHAHYVTTDIAPVAFLLLGAWTIRRHPNAAGAAAAGVFLGAALASKFAAPLLLPFALAWIFARARARGLFIAASVCLLVLYGIEAYASRGMNEADLRSLSRRAFHDGGLGGPASPAPALERFCDSLASASRPAAAYAIGLLDVANRSASSENVDYWAGRIVHGPQPLYPLETLAAKDDVPLLVAAIAGAILLARRRTAEARGVGRGAGWLALAAGVFYLAAACRSSVHLGIRHLLPVVVLFAALAASVPLARFRPALVLLAAAHVAAAAFAFPHFVSYRNIPARLAVKPPSAWDLGDDWGQDLGRFLKRQPASVVYLSVIHYRNPVWRSLFPKLGEDGEGRWPYLVDAVGVDLVNASRRRDLAPTERRELSGLQPILDRIAKLLSEGTVRETREPTLLLIEPAAAR